MQEPSVSSQAGFGSLALWVGIWAIVISLVCLYLGIDARNVAKDSERRLERTVELLDESEEKVVQLEMQVRESLELSTQQLQEMSFSVEQNANRIETNTTQITSTRRVASELINGLTSQKEAITDLAMRIPAIPQDVQIVREPAPEPETIDDGPASPEPSTATAVSVQESAPPTYTVKSGDTLVDIARRLNFSVPDLLDANPTIDPNVIRVGQKLNLPE
ncbi:MAG: LysM peptidoglycan-binding domain-containing protein [Verrucomicrobiota bacterium]